MAGWRWGCPFSTELDGPFVVFFEKQSRERSDEFDGEGVYGRERNGKKNREKGKWGKEISRVDWVQRLKDACGKVSQKRNCLHQRDWRRN